MAKATTIRLSDGNEIPALGLGTYVRGGSKNNECQYAVEAALDCGYRHIDTATFYQNEEEVGAAIAKKIKEGVVTREDLFITTKLWNDKHEECLVVPSLKESLSKLSMSYVDLYLLHWPMGFKADGTFNDNDYVDVWKGIERCRELGLTKSIGVSNFSIQQLERLLRNCTIRPVVVQCEANPNLTQKDLTKFCKENDMTFVAYSPLGSLPEMKVNETSPDPRYDDPLLKAIGDKYRKTPTQVVLRYLLDRGLAVLPKSVKPARIAENIDVFDFHLTEEEIEKIDRFNKNYRVVPVRLWRDHKYYPFK